MWPNAKISVMGPDQLSSVMQTVSGKGSTDTSRWDGLKREIERQSTAVYSSARIWVRQS